MHTLKKYSIKKYANVHKNSYNEINFILRKNVRRSISRVLCPKGVVIIHLILASLLILSDQPEHLPANWQRFKKSSVFLFGLAPSGVYHAFYFAIKAVVSYSTFSPLPIRGRFVFCGTFPKYGLKPIFGRRYLPLYLHGARTFLSRSLSALRQQSPDRLTIFFNDCFQIIARKNILRT